MKKNNLQNKKGLALRNSKGITLTETILYVAIFSIFMIALAQFSTTLSATRLYTQRVLEVNDQGSYIINLMTQTLRNGSSINAPTPGASGSTLSIATYESVTNPTVFSLIDGVLYSTEGENSPIALTNNTVLVSNLTFSNVSQINTPSIVKISVTLTSVDTRNPYSVTFEGSATLRK